MQTGAEELYSKTKIILEEITDGLKELGYLIEEEMFSGTLLITKTFERGKFCCELSNNNSFLVYVVDKKKRRYFKEYGVYGNNNSSKQVINTLHAIFHKKSRLL
ncbi:hypothetical protein [Priestia aryabhattai]